MNTAASASNRPRLLAQQRCFHHGHRESVARCMDCGRYFCRECITEHDRRMLCSACLVQKTDRQPVSDRRWFQTAVLLVQCGVGFAVIWYTFYLIGTVLLSIPNSFHEGQIWDPSWWAKQ